MTFLRPRENIVSWNLWQGFQGTHTHCDFCPVWFHVPKKNIVVVRNKRTECRESLLSCNSIAWHSCTTPTQTASCELERRKNLAPFLCPFLIVMPSIPWDIYFTGLSSGCNTHIAPHSINTVVALAGRVPAALHWKPGDWRQTGASTWHRGISLSADNLRGATWIVLVVRAGLRTQSANEWQLNKLLADMRVERYGA